MNSAFKLNWRVVIGVLFKYLIGFVKCSYCIGRFWKNSHNGIADSFYNGTALFNYSLFQNIKVVHHYADCRFVSVFTVQVGGVIEVGEQYSQVFSVQFLFIPYKLFREKISEELPGANLSCRNGKLLFAYVFTSYHHNFICLVMDNQIWSSGEVDFIRQRSTFPEVNRGITESVFINLSLNNLITFI